MALRAMTDASPDKFLSIKYIKKIGHWDTKRVFIYVKNSYKSLTIRVFQVKIFGNWCKKGSGAMHTKTAVTCSSQGRVGWDGKEGVLFGIGFFEELGSYLTLISGI